jgi:hypothetical protein
MPISVLHHSMDNQDQKEHSMKRGLVLLIILIGKLYIFLYF